MPGLDGVASPYTLVIGYGAQLLGGLRRAFGRGNPRIVEPIARDGTVPASRRPPPAPPAPPPPPIGATQPPYQPNKSEPRRTKPRGHGRGHRAVKRFLENRSVAAFTTWLDSLPDPVKAGIEYAANNPVGAPGLTLPKSARPPPIGTPPMGSKSAQRGFVAPELVPLIANPPMPVRQPPPARMPKVPSTPAATPGVPARVRPGAPPPASMPGADPLVDPRPTAPEVGNPVFYEPDVRTAIERIPSTEPVYPGPGPAKPAPSPARVPGPSGPSTAKPGKTGPGTPVALPTLGKIVLSPDSLLAYAVGTLPRRSSAAGTISPGLSPGTAPARSTAPTALATMMQPQRIDDPTCDCKKQKTKDRQPRAPRTVCWRGTYVETAKGLTKKRISLVNC